MERLYRQFKDRAEFRMVYINEAHASDSRWSVPHAKEKGLTEHDSIDDRCEAAGKLLDGEHLTIPCIVDDMDNAVNESYRAWPDRIYIVRTDGRLGLVAAAGPAGFKPALDEVRTWLESLKATGEEPALTESAASPGEDQLVPQERTKVEEAMIPENERPKRGGG